MRMWRKNLKDGKLQLMLINFIIIEAIAFMYKNQKFTYYSTKW